MGAARQLMCAPGGDGPNSTYTRVAFNKVGKAGGSELASILSRLAPVLGYTLVRAKRFNPPTDELAATLSELRCGQVYSNHAQHLRTTARDLAWINVVREPIDREQSLFYYFVDPVARKSFKANASLAARRRDMRCGYAGLEFDACIRLRHARGCPLGCTAGQMSAFCAPSASSCSLLEAAAALDDYLFVGLMEEYDLTVRVFEALLPQFFEGASATYNDKRRRRPKAGATRNPVTGTLGLGAVSKSARGILLNTSSCAQEARFYALAKRKFWLIAGRVFGTGLLDARV